MYKFIKNTLFPLMAQFSKNFFVCGLTGWCIEILFTSCKSLTKTNRKLLGQTSVWMFPIYGCAACFKPMYRLIQKRSPLTRSFIYACSIFTGEYISGSILKKHACCPWDYSTAHSNIHGIIRLDYTPLWMLAGLLFEQILCRKK